MAELPNQEKDMQQESTETSYTDSAAKPKKKRSVKKIVFACIGGAIALFIVVNIISGLISGPAPLAVQTQLAATGEVSQTLNTTGTLTTAERKIVYAPVSAPIATASLEAGQTVVAGEQLFTFNTVDLERSYRQAAAARALTGSQAKEATNNSNENQQDAADYEKSINEQKGQRDIAKGLIASLTAQKAQKEAELAAAQAAGDAALEAQITAELQDISAALAQQQADLQQIEALISSMEGLRKTADATVLSEEQKKQQQYSQVSSQVSYEVAAENLANGKAGVVAPISGIVTAVNASEGAMATQYSPLCTIESLEKVNVVVALSRYDLERVQVGQKATVTSLGKEYAATVEKIDAMATSSTTTTGTSSFVSCTVSLDAPDADIHLGLEATVVIATGRVENAVTVPLNAINTDVDGSYCYVVENGVAVRRSVVVGLSSDTLVEIKEGVSTGEEVILSSQDVTEGAAVAAVAGTVDTASSSPLQMAIG
ncbi:MAG: efflux RND transporter periplasmic adaptor subunit [Oscillospiraceae bacterium]